LKFNKLGASGNPVQSGLGAAEIVKSNHSSEGAVLLHFLQANPIFCDGQISNITGIISGRF